MSRILKMSAEADVFYSMKTKQQKQEILNQLAEHLAKQQAMMFVSYKGLKVGDMTSLRNQLKEAGAKLVVAKKTLLSKVLREKKIEENLKDMEGQIGTIFAFDDPFAPMKIAYAFGKTNGNLKILGGYFENELQNAANIVAIANLPSREELLSRLVGTMAFPMSGFVSVLQGNIKGLMTVLTRRSETVNS